MRKNKLKLFIIICLLFITTGCSATYNINIDDKNVLEDLTLNDINITTNQAKKFTTNAIPVDINLGCFLDYDSDVSANEVEKEDGVNYYDVSSKDNNLIFKSRVQLNHYKNSRGANSFFNNINVNNYDNMISIYGYNGIVAFDLYPELDNVEVNITSKLKVVKDNADSVDNNTYTWSFDRNSSDEKTLYIQFSPDEKVKSSRKFTKAQVILVICCFSLIVLMPVIYIFSKKIKYK